MVTEQKIRTFVGEQNFQKGQQAVRDGAIVNHVPLVFDSEGCALAQRTAEVSLEFLEQEWRLL